ncbi:hypothetical protein BVRB_6g138140 isoform A [Beta vulgaris subsp. vulgaris]|uniref:uncharacterized protein LOC104895984 isoform X2 n=1 Tax=Beta vulgaris subsp. vulgaris TaxID=3555 RepID=UPI00053FCE93|nr:uncharacterized protein LOC104895984 isoform X2 [Beta vulgaris subsp. vulgaris]KMT08532.1 hypothetical protein BVRB_6g138140 isoform A [Beta vulgaris subsp. vulgaris]
MGLEENGDGKMLGLRMIARHKRSKSFPDKRRVESGDSLEESPRPKLDIGRVKGSFNTKKQQSPRVGTQNSLKQEILQLEKRLQDQFAVRRTLEKALGSGSSAYETDEPSTVPKPATDLIKEIAVLELEVGYLEQYLLSLYRKAFDQSASTVSPNTKDYQASLTSPTIKNQKISSTSLYVTDQRLKPPLVIPRRLFVDEDAAETATKAEFSAVQSVPKTLSNTLKEPSESKALDSNVHRCHSSLSHRTALPSRPSPDSVAKALRACHSQPLSMSEYAASNVISLAEHLGARISDHIPETPNRISEDMVKCMAAIFCKLGEPPATNNGLSSPNSSSSSMGAFSPHYQCDAWSPSYGKDSSFDTRLDNPFNVEGLKEFSGPYSTMVEVPCIYRESQKLGDVEYMLQNFRSLISQLQEVDPKKLMHEEKLAFWINVHNALVMHAFLAYGIPQNNVKRVFLLLKAAYNVGGHTISADTIQSVILGCRMSRPGQWLRMLLSPRTKFKGRDDRQAYALDHPEPLLHFALCSGSHSDPALRVYTPKRVSQELEGAKDEYIRATFGVRKDQKVVLPKVVESYSKDSGLCSASVIEMIQQSLPDSMRKSLKKCQAAKSRKIIEWMPHNFTFRYLISKELVK